MDPTGCSMPPKSEVPMDLTEPNFGTGSNFSGESCEKGSTIPECLKYVGRRLKIHSNIFKFQAVFFSRVEFSR